MFHTHCGAGIGRLVRFICIAIVCDHPAAVKMSGCADKGHSELPCTQCQVSQDDFFSDESLSNGEFLTVILFYWFHHKLTGYHERDTAQHIAKAYEYANLDSDSDRQEFFKKHGVRWYEFARLPYFDPVKMTVIDPMHNLLIGMTFLSYVFNVQ